jgi:tetratricopeptide (TPR) repeat protein
VPNPEPAYYRALALGKLGRQEEKKAALDALRRQAEQSLAAPDAASAGPRRRRKADAPAAHYAAGLACAGLGDAEKARAEFQAVLALNPAHVGARSELAALK